MAAARARGALPIGSLSWINDENAQIQRHCEQEVEDFSFSARNDLDWLNEHMADVFAKDQLSFADILKTPGKLRGKTPRTVRKRNPLETREPLSTIFGNNAANQPVLDSPRQSPQRAAYTFTVAEDAPNKLQTYPEKKPHTDSGYQGLSEDEFDTDQKQQLQNTNKDSGKTLHQSLQVSSGSLGQSDDRSTTERSFHSAREDITKTGVVESAQPLVGNDGAATSENLPPFEPQDTPMLAEEDDMDKDIEADSVMGGSRSPSQGSSPERPLVRKSSLTFAALPAREPLTTKKSIGARTSQTTHLDHPRGSAHHSTFLGRITGGKSFGDPKLFQDEHEDVTDMNPEQEATLTRDESDAESKMTKLHNKSSTQRLHERINLLGKSQTHRPTKSIPTTTSGAAQPIYPELPSEVQGSKSETVLPESDLKDQKASQDDDEEEDWIQSPNSADPTLHPSVSKTILADTTEMESIKQSAGNSVVRTQQRPQVANKVSSPLPQPSMRVLETDQFRTASDSQRDSPGICSSYDGVKTFDDREARHADLGSTTTPVGSPMAHRHLDGTLSASKSKLQLIMKTARGLFSSSAGVSAQAKMETLAANTSEAKSTNLPKDQGDQEHGIKVSFHDAKLTQMKAKPKSSDDHGFAISAPKTRSSTEKENRERQQQADEHQSVHEREITSKEKHPEASNVTKSVNAEHPPSKPVRQSPRKTRDPEFANSAAQESIPSQATNDTVAQPQHRPQVPRTKDPKRPVRPTKDAASKPKPQPVAIRVGMPSAQRMPLSNSVLSSTLSESLPAAQKQAAVTKNPGFQSSVSNTSLKSSVSSTATKPKALLAAERKREQEEKEAQRKLEQKKEIERRRAAQQEEVRRQEQILRQEAEKQREKERAAAAEDPKKLAQRQAIEKRRMDLNKKDQPRMPQRPLPEQPLGNARPELGGTRPPSRQHNGLESVRPANNQLTGHGKPGIKRVFEPDADVAPPRPRTQGAPVYQQVEGKRRRTESEEPEEFPMRPTHAPPIRQSGMRKDAVKPPTFTNIYSTAPPPAAHHYNGPPQMKSAASSQAYQQVPTQGQVLRVGNPPDMKQYMTGKIPFAELPNPPSMQQQQQPPQPPFKTPYQPKQQYATGAGPPPPPKTFSPQYPNGENIHLEDIPTDPEEDESDADSDSASAAANAKAKASNLPEWAQSPNLHQLLETQDERMDADAVFGPVQSPHIEEMFKERHHRFRNRTSSANWAGSDRLTEEEIRRDVEARRKLRRDGGWTFGL